MKPCVRRLAAWMAAALLGLTACTQTPPEVSAPPEVLSSPQELPTPEVVIPPEESPAPDLPPPETAPPPAPPTEEEIDAFFDDAVLVGDSVMAGIERYVRKERQTGELLGKARFLTTTIGIKVSDCAGDNGADTVYFSYRGDEKPPEEILTDMNPQKIVLMLGMNDLAAGDAVADIIDAYGRLIDRIEQALPGVFLCIGLNTPRTDSTWVADYTANKRFYNSLIDEFNAALRELCELRSVPCIDLNTPLKAGTNGLPQEYTNDGYLHLNSAGAQVVIETLREFAKEEKR